MSDVDDDESDEEEDTVEAREENMDTEQKISSEEGIKEEAENMMNFYLGKDKTTKVR
jgi:hypothetical protein